MDALISLMNHPYLTGKLGGGDDDQKRTIDAVYPISLFFAFGIYLVFERYQKMHNSAVPFEWTFPEVHNFSLSFILLNRSNMSFNRPQSQPGIL